MDPKREGSSQETAAPAAALQSHYSYKVEQQERSLGPKYGSFVKDFSQSSSKESPESGLSDGITTKTSWVLEVPLPPKGELNQI